MQDKESRIQSSWSKPPFEVLLLPFRRTKDKKRDGKEKRAIKKRCLHGIQLAAAFHSASEGKRRKGSSSAASISIGVGIRLD
jgi:hypothetical protein